jgi:hypothetical protein
MCIFRIWQFGRSELRASERNSSQWIARSDTFLPKSAIQLAQPAVCYAWLSR